MLVYSAEDFAGFFSNMLTNGVVKHKSADALKVIYTSGYNLSVSDGVAMINGYQFACEGEVLIATALSSDTTRYDRVVLKLDLNDEVNAITMYIKEGSSSSYPSLTRDETVHELSLAKLAVTINGITVTDERDDENICGVCRFIVQTPMHDGIVFGKYTGNGEAKREIYLGFTPTAVEVYRCDGLQNSLHAASSYHEDHYGGLALKGQNCYDYDKPIITVKEGGFNVYYNVKENSHCILTNLNNTNYYFKAYRDFEIMEV